MKIFRKICLISNFNKKIIRPIDCSKKVKNSLSFYNSPNQKRSHTQNQVLKNKMVPQNTVIKSKMCSPQNEKHFVTVRLPIRVLIFMRLTAEQHCVKSVQIQSFFWSVFSSIPNTGKYGPEKSSVFGLVVYVFQYSLWFCKGNTLLKH